MTDSDLPLAEQFCALTDAGADPEALRALCATPGFDASGAVVFFRGVLCTLLERCALVARDDVADRAARCSSVAAALALLRAPSFDPRREAAFLLVWRLFECAAAHPVAMLDTGIDMLRALLTHPRFEPTSYLIQPDGAKQSCVRVTMNLGMARVDCVVFDMIAQHYDQLDLQDTLDAMLQRRIPAHMLRQLALLPAIRFDAPLPPLPLAPLRNTSDLHAVLSNGASAEGAMVSAPFFTVARLRGVGLVFLPLIRCGIALACGMHPRLGERSPCRHLSAALIAVILKGAITPY
eukprot:TRINITY_DN8617_c0_g1_i1.p1 TRINITY_DN8617_c0_g1~~TRINITY_DN8617_c0_g1_i1.p1  ORF type:complete len:293 (+),score=74.55 TRINITY_DN8617_c0_g1_i1:8-886(+)